MRNKLSLTSRRRPPVTRGAPGSGPGGPRRIVFFGKILDYKGVEDLLAAFAAVPAAAAAATELIVAGQCDDKPMRSRLQRAAGERVVLRLERVA
ncbi:MAG TPA: hypothetical protein VIX15_03355, partial [Streptosporangiaceae bacterium]